MTNSNSLKTEIDMLETSPVIVVKSTSDEKKALDIVEEHKDPKPKISV